MTENLEGVVVVGAGPVGFLSALGLARAGVPVTVIEAEAGINESPRAAVYFPNTLRILGGLGLMDEVEAIAYKSTRSAAGTRASSAWSRMPLESP